jgi:Ca2+/Na+ antiporter
MIQEIFLGLFLIFAIWGLVHIIGVVSDGRFMDWTDYFKQKLKLDNFTAGETIQALGTSAPEISISFLGLYIMGENPALGLATIIGSAIFQITVVIGIPLLFAPKSTTIEYKGLLRTAFVYGVSVLLLYVFLTNDNMLSGIELMALALYHIGYVIYIIRGHKSSHEEDIEESHPDEIPSKIWIFRVINKVLEKIPAPESKYAFIGKFPLGFFLTILVIAIACAFFIEASVSFAEMIGVSSGLIALTILAGGSSVPELFSNIPLAKKGNIDQAIGNAFGSNTLDICISFAFVSIPFAFLNDGIKGANVEEMLLPIYFLFGYLFIVLGIFALSKFKTYKWQGYVLNLLFIIFVVISYLTMKTA